MRKYKRWLWIFLLLVIIGSMLMIYHQARKPEATAETKAVNIAKKYAKLKELMGSTRIIEMQHIIPLVVKTVIITASSF